MNFLNIFKKKELEKQEELAKDIEVANSEKPLLSNNLKLGYTQDDAGNWARLYLPVADRSTHVYVLGSSGVGKSKGLANWILEDINYGHGYGVIDPHGDLINDIVGNLIPINYEQVILVEMTNPEHIIGFNPLEQQEGIDPYTQSLELVEVFRKIKRQDSWRYLEIPF